MTKHRFFLLNVIWADEVRVEHKDTVHQILNVLRFKHGDKLIVLDNQGFEYEAEIKTAKPLVLKISDKKLNRHEPSQKITLYQSLI